MKIEIAEIWSGFANVPNGLILAANYGNSADRPGSTYDAIHTVEIDGAKLVENVFGEIILLVHDKFYAPISIENGMICFMHAPDDIFRKKIIK